MLFLPSLYFQQMNIDNNNLQVTSEVDSLSNTQKINEAQKEAICQRRHAEYINSKLALKRQRLKKLISESQEESDNDIQDNVNVSDHSSHSDGKEEKVLKLQTMDQTIKKEGLDNIPINILKKGEWIIDVLQLSDKTLEIMNKSYEIKGLNKLKIIADPVQGYPYRIKASFKNSQLMFSPSLGRYQQKNGIFINYYAFSTIIEKHLNLLRYKLNCVEPSKDEVSKALTDDSFIWGKMYKKSQIIGKWQQRFIVINKQGLFSYKKNISNYTMHIQNGSIKQMWTRFEVSQGFLVIKIIHNGKKTQFKLPLTELVTPKCWLYYFFVVMNSKN